MSDAADPRAGAGDAAGEPDPKALAKLYRSGLVLVVHDAGKACTALAHAVAEQCAGSRVKCHLLTVDELVDLDDLAVYTTLVLVWPASSGTSADDKIVARFARIYAAYREFRSSNLPDVLAGAQSWWFAGVTYAILWGREVGDLGVNPFPDDKRPCVVRGATDPASVGDIFDAYRLGLTPSGYDPHEEMLREGLVRWDEARSWNVQSLDEAEEIYRLIEKRIEHWDDYRFPKNRRPIKGIELNRLQLMFRDPEMVFPKDALPEAERDIPSVRKAANKAFREAGAMVARDLIKHIRQSYPHVVRPDDRPNTKGNQKAVTALYKALLYLRGIPAEVRDRIAES